MSCRKCGSSTSEALKRVFLVPTGSALRVQGRPALSLQRIQHRDVTSANGHVLPNQYYARPTAPPKNFGPAGFTRQPRDLDLPSIIRLVDQQGTLSNPQQRNVALQKMNRKQYFLVQVSEGEDGAPPICKKVKKEVVFEQDRERFKPKKQDSTLLKEIEMGWKLADGDLNHKMDMLRSFLENGKKVDVTLVARRKRDMLEPEVAKPFLDKVRQRVAEVVAGFPGGREKEMTGTPGKMVTITIEPPQASTTKTTTLKDKVPKLVRMNWAFLDTELDAKARRIGELVTANALVDLEISARVPKFEISEDAGQEVLAKVKKRIKKQPNCVEIASMDGVVGKSVTLHYGNEVQLGVYE